MGAKATQSFTQSFVLISLVSLISVGACFLCSIGLGSGLRLNAQATLHPYDYFTSWRYALGLAMPILMLALSWIYRSNPAISMLDMIHMALAWGTIGWMVFVFFYEINVLVQCNDLTSTLAFDHPQCVNRNHPSNTKPDIGLELYFIGLCINGICCAYWVIFSFQVGYSYSSVAWRTAAMEAAQARDQQILTGSKINHQKEFTHSTFRTKGRPETKSRGY